MKLIEVTDDYVNYMKQFFKSTMLDSKEGIRTHNRKYLGIIISINGNNYFAPLSSPKKSDFSKDEKIKKSTSIVLRMIKKTKTKESLLGTIKLNNMMPVPNSEILPYDLSKEEDIKYKNLVIEELEWIQHNTRKIVRTATTLYYLKINENKNKNNKNEKYFNSIMPFIVAEEKCREYIILKNK